MTQQEWRRLWIAGRLLPAEPEALSTGNLLVLASAAPERLKAFLEWTDHWKLGVRVTLVLRPEAAESIDWSNFPFVADQSILPNHLAFNPANLSSLCKGARFMNAVCLLNTRWGFDYQSVFKAMSALAEKSFAFNAEDQLLASPSASVLEARQNLLECRPSEPLRPRSGVLMDLRTSGNSQTGVGRYTHELTKAFTASHCEIRLLGEPPPSLKISPERFISAELPLSDLDLADSYLERMDLWERPDLHFSPYYPGPSSLAPRSVITIHDLFPLSHPEWTANENVIRFFDQRLRNFARQAAAIITPSESTKHEVISQYRIPSERIHVIPHGLTQLPEPSPEAVAAVVPTRPYFLFVGSFEPRKNLSRLLQAYEVFRQRHSGGEAPLLVLAGFRSWGGADRPEAVLENHAFRKDIVILRGICDSWLHALYRHCLAFVFPSLDEGFGLPVLEAMGHGAPVICSNTGALREVGGDAVLYVDPLDPEQITEGMETLVDDTGFRENLLKKGRCQAGIFIWNESVQKHVRVFERVLCE